MKNIYGEEVKTLAKEVIDVIDANMGRTTYTYGISHNIPIDIDTVAISENIEMEGRMAVDKLAQHFDYAFFFPIVVCYWRSRNFLIHIDGYHRLWFKKLNYDDIPQMEANVYDVEAIMAKITGVERELTEEEVIQFCADKFLSQKDGCAQLKAIDCFYAELNCSDEKRRRVAKIIWDIQNKGYYIKQKGAKKTDPGLPFTLIKDMASAHGEEGTEFVCKIASIMLHPGNKAIRTLGKFLVRLKDANHYNPETLSSCEEILISLLEGKEIDEIFNIKGTEASFTEKASKRLFNIVKTEGGLR